MTIDTQAPCLICRQPLTIRPCRGRKSGKPSLMVICPVDGRHFRGFINDQAYVKEVLARLEGQTPPSSGEDDLDTNSPPETDFKTNLERDNS